MLTIPVSLLTIHFIADFLLQNDWMAVNKSKRWDALTLHVFIYSLTFTLLLLVNWPFSKAILFGLMTFITHFLTDAVTSRVGRKLFPWTPINDPFNIRVAGWPPRGPEDITLYEDFEGEPSGIPNIPRSRHWFFSCIGLDQLIHAVTLAYTFHWFVR